jgi:hypothetical protein
MANPAAETTIAAQMGQYWYVVPTAACPLNEGVNLATKFADNCTSFSTFGNIL